MGPGKLENQAPVDQPPHRLPGDGDALRYEVEVNLANENNSHTQLALLTGRDKKVLEVGPATGYLTRVLKDRGCHVTGVEIDPIAAAKAEAFCERMIVADIEDLDFARVLGDERFEVVIYGDVLEHLSDPARVLERTVSILAPGGYVLASIPNVTHGSVRLALLSGTFGYTETGILDRTHLRFFDRAGVAALFEEASYVIKEWRRTTVDPFATELGLREEEFPPHLVDNVRKAPDALTYQFVVRAELNAQARKGPTPQGIRVTTGESLAGLWRLEEHAENLEKHAENLEKHAENLEKSLDSSQQLAKHLKAQTRELDDRLRQTLGERDRAVVEAEDLRRRMQQLESGLAFRLSKGLASVIDRLGPWGTRRRSVMLTPARLVNSAFTEGWGSFFRRLVRVWEWIPQMFRRAYPRLDRLTFPQLYRLWLELCILTPRKMRKARRQAKRLGYRPRVSIIMPVFNSEPGWLRGAFDSVLGQVYENWELCIVDDGSVEPETLAVLREYERRDRRIHVRHLGENRGIAAASNAGLTMATGEFVGFLDHDDELKKNAIYEVVRLLNASPDLDFVYSDEDKRNEVGQLCEPFFKPDWSPDLLMSVNYVTHFAVYRTDVVERVGGFREDFEGSQDYDLILRVSELTDRVGHVPLPLYTWRKVPGSAAAKIDAKAYALKAAERALWEAVSRRGYEGSVGKALVPGRYRVRYGIRGNPRVTIVIPTRDKVDLLRRCIESIETLTTYEHYNVVIVDNDSRTPETLEYLKAFPGRVLRYPHPFNYAKMMNFVVSGLNEAEFVLLLNNDTEVISSEWLEAMLEHAQRPEVGVVGARLLYRDGRPQHEGIFLWWLGGCAGNIDFGGYQGLGETIRNCSAVTGACMLVRADVYRELGGLDERLGVAFNDVDFCLRLRQKGYEVVYTPYAVLYHDESATRGTLHPPEDERLFRERWGGVDARDPYYNPNLDPQRPFRLQLCISP